MEDIEKIAGTFRAWRSSPENSKLKTSKLTSYIDVSGFCKSATLQEIATHDHTLTVGRYVGAENVEDDGDSFNDKLGRLAANLALQFADSAKLKSSIKDNLKGLGYAP